MTHCTHCNETFFSVDVLRYDTSNKPVIQPFSILKYCPFCGKALKKVEVKPNGVYVD